MRGQPRPRRATAGASPRLRTRSPRRRLGTRCPPMRAGDRAGPACPWARCLGADEEAVLLQLAGVPGLDLVEGRAGQPDLETDGRALAAAGLPRRGGSFRTV